MAASLVAQADTFVLKDGTRVEGTIVSEEGDSYVLEVQVTKSIKDERKIAKADVVKIDRDKPDLKAFEAIAKIVPTPDLLTDEEYGERLIAVRNFLKEFPSSDKSKAAEAMLETLKAESTQIASGGVKISGSIITPAEYKVNAYDLDAKVKEAEVRKLVDKREFLAALRAYTGFCADFQGTTAYASLSPIMQQVMRNQIAESKQALLTLDERTKKRLLGLERMTPEDRRISESAIAEESANIEARLKAEKDAHIVWVTPSPYSKAALEESVRAGEAEMNRLGTVDTTLGQDAGKAWRDAFAMIRSSSNEAAVTAAVTAARTAGVSPKYMAMLEAAMPRKK